MSSVTKRDYYEVLGVERTATEQQIKSAYRKLALKFHPDRNPGDHKAEEAFKEAAEAYAILADQEKKGLYDRFGHAGVGCAAGGGRIRPDDLRGLLRHLRRPRRRVRPRGHLRPAPPPRRPAARRRSALRPGDLVRGVRDRVPRPRSRFRARKPARRARARAPRPAPPPRRAPSAKARASSATSRVSSPWRARARRAAAPAGRSPSRARRAAAPDVSAASAS